MPSDYLMTKLQPQLSLITCSIPFLCNFCNTKNLETINPYPAIPFVILASTTCKDRG